MNEIIHSPTGIIHFLSALVALGLGPLVLYLPKGSMLHRRVGYGYAAAMIIMLLTAFSIYALFGGFGVFHWLAVLSTLTLIGGMVPIVLQRPAKTYLTYHFSFMYWSVIGLYLALFGEVAAHLPAMLGLTGKPAVGLLVIVGVGALAFCLGAQLIWNRQKREWYNRYGTIATGESAKLPPQANS
ncbi:MAG: hypothetical protein WA952_21080 [Lewinella sp.]